MARQVAEQMELYVVGPGFNLPSLDAECNAAVALLKAQREGGWTIISTHEHTRRLPYLKHHGQCIEGLRNINRHILNLSDSKTSGLKQEQKADAIALSSFITSHAQLLLDISLYVSYENYLVTRSAFTKILPWYANYIIPPTRRNAARARTEHLGISSIDVDDVHEDLSNKPSGMADVGKEKSFEPETQQRASLLLPSRNTVSGLLRRREHSAVFKLHALAENFFEPLQDMLGDTENFLGRKELSEVDCLAYGYLSLMLYPDLQQSWLKSTLRKKYPRLVAYTERIHRELRMETRVDDVIALAECHDEESAIAAGQARGMTLPWSRPATPTIIDAASTIFHELVSRIPFFGSATTIVTLPPTKSNFLRQYFPALFATAAASIALLGYHAFATGLIVWPHGEELHIIGRKRLSDYGHLGAALAGMSLMARSTAQNDGLFHQDNDSLPMGVAIEAENDAVT